MTTTLQECLSRNCAGAYMRGASLREIAKRIGMSHECVRRMLIKRGIEMRQRGRPSNGR